MKGYKGNTFVICRLPD